MSTAIESRCDRVVLNNISWGQFENLLVDLGDRRVARIAYDRGTLEIMTPLPDLIAQNKDKGRRVIRQEVRNWVRSQMNNRSGKFILLKDSIFQLMTLLRY